MHFKAEAKVLKDQKPSHNAAEWERKLVADRMTYAPRRKEQVARWASSSYLEPLVKLLVEEVSTWTATWSMFAFDKNGSVEYSSAAVWNRPVFASD